MGLLKALKQAFWRSESAALGDACPRCGDPVVSRADRVQMDGRVYHPECAWALLDARPSAPAD